MKKVVTIVVAVACAALLCVGFYFLKNGSGSGEAAEDLTEVQQIITKNLETDYPQTPRAVVKLYNRILSAYYGESYTDEEFDGLLAQARALFDDDLAEQNTAEEYKASVQASIDDYKERSYRIRQTRVCDTDDVEYKTDSSNGDEVAYVKASYFTEENGAFEKTYQMYVLRKDADGKWKILTFYKVSADTTEDEDDE